MLYNSSSFELKRSDFKDIVKYKTIQDVNKITKNSIQKAIYHKIKNIQKKKFSHNKSFYLKEVFNVGCLVTQLYI